MKRKTKRIVITILLSLLSLIIGYTVAYYLFGVKALDELREKYSKELEIYKMDFDQSCYLLVHDVKEGDEVKKEDFTIQVIPQNLYNEGLIVDLEDLDGAKYSRDFLKNSLAYKDMFYHLKDLQKDLRRYEIAAISLSEQAKVSDYVDVRINFPSGLDYVVLAKKRIEDLSYEGDEKVDDNSKIISTFFLTSEEILRLSSALVDAYLTEGAFLYTTTYVSAHNQEEAKITYPTNEAVQELMAQDPNVVRRAIVELENSKRKLLTSSLISYIENEQLQLISTLKNQDEEEAGDETVDKAQEDKKTGPGNKEDMKKPKEDKDEEINMSDSNSID